MFTASWYFDILHEPVETIDELIGKNYDYAHKMYFRTDPDRQYKVNINNNLNIFDSAILAQKEILTDSIVHVFTWNYITHKKTIWVGSTNKSRLQVIDALRYNNRVRF